MSPTSELPRSVRSSWHGFLETYEPLRTDLYRYCRHLTRSPWDAEDLAQDTLARAFVTLGQMGDAPPNPRAWLFRVAYNLWVDRTRRRREEPLDADVEDAPAGDLDRLTALLLDQATVEVVGATTQYGPEAARRTVLYGMLFGVKRMATADVSGGIEPRFVQGVVPSPPRVEARAHRGGWVLLHFYAHHDGDAVRALTRVEVDGDRVARLQNYFFNPDLIAEVCGELAVPVRSNGHRWCLPDR
jgi:DNA-directed RNA polymerase specialized sigma24 family protein